MRPTAIVVALLATVWAVGCESPTPRPPLAERDVVDIRVDSAFATVPESVWVEVSGPTLIGFYSAKSNEELEADTALAIALDDLSYHIGTAMDSLTAAGFDVRYSSGDTVWMRAGRVRARFVRAPDSATVGYVFTDTLGRRAVLYGVRTYVDLIEYAHEFKRTGAIAAR